MSFNHALAIDFGTDTIKISDRKNRVMICEKNMIAIRDDGKVMAVGDAAYDMYEKTPANIKAGCPMAHGVIAEGKNAERVLTYLLKKNRRFLSGHPAMFIAVPRDISQVEKRAYYNVLCNIVQERKIYLVDKGLADTIGVGVSMESPRASMLVNIGAGTTEICVVAGGRVLISKTLPVGGRAIDEEIIKMVRRMFQVNISEKTAVRLKNRLAYVEHGPEDQLEVFGISTLSGLPVTTVVPSEAVSDALIGIVDQIAAEMKGILDRLPPQFYHDILTAGLCLAGGSSLIVNLSDYMRKKLSVPISIVREPGLTTLRGVQAIMSHPALGEAFTFSLKDLNGKVV
ncbi:MAG: rod shape-determining protein [Eubacteriales bacterium]|nr:rod shape-determining protein [Eubacteriales bacterium]